MQYLFLMLSIAISASITFPSLDWALEEASLFKNSSSVIIFISFVLLNFLISKGVNHEKQKKFDWLGRQSLDFFLPDYNIAIECQGIQHEQPVNFFGGEEQFKIQKEHDKRKKEYSKSHNIELLEIWYYEYNNVEEILTSRLALKQST